MQRIFSGNSNIDKTAYLNWRLSPADDIRNLLVMADGFMISSIELAKICLIDNVDKRADILIFPILTNANHGIELYLKAIAWIVNKLTNSDSKIEGSHNIKQIFENVRSKIKSYKGHQSLKIFDEETIQLQNYIKELFEKVNSTNKKDKMDFSRYPFTKDYENYFYVEEIGNVEIDLENFLNRFKIIHTKLENISDYFFYHDLNQNDNL